MERGFQISISSLFIRWLLKCNKIYNYLDSRFNIVYGKVEDIMLCNNKTSHNIEIFHFNYKSRYIQTKHDVKGKLGKSKYNFRIFFIKIKFTTHLKLYTFTIS